MDLSLKFKADIDTDLLVKKINSLTAELQKSLGALGTKIEFIDEASLTSQFRKIENEFSIMEETSKRMQTNLQDIQPKIDVSQIEKGVEQINKFENDLNNVNLSKGEEQFDKLGDAANKLVDSLGDTNMAQSVEALASEFDKLNSKFSQQQKALAVLESSGKKGTEEYKKLKEEAEATGKQVEELNKVMQDANKATSFMDRLAKFGLVSQGIQNLTSAFSQLSVPYMELDAATQAMRTLGGEAIEMAPKLREASIVMSKDLPFAAGEIQSAMQQAIASGVQGGVDGLTKFAETAAKLATGGGASLESVVQGLGSTLNAFGETSQETARYSDYMFNIVNIGTTTIDQLNSSLAGVTPTAASMGITFDKVGGALALMTQKGVSTNRAVTRLNALMLEMAKPSAGLNNALQAAGVSVDDFQQQISDDFLGALKTLQSGFEKTGKSATQSFSSSQAGSAFNLLMSDAQSLEEALDFVANTTNSTEDAFQEMGETVQVQAQNMKASMDAFVIETIDGMGGAGASMVVFSQTLSTLSPQITALSGIGALIPDGFASKVTDLAGAFGKNLTSGMGLATNSMKAFTMSLATNPIFLAIAAITTLVVATKLLSDALHESAEEKLADAEAENDILKSKIEINKQERDLAKSRVDLVKSFEKEGEAAMQNANLMTKLAKSYPGVVSSSKSYKENLDALKKAAANSSKELSKLDDEMTELAQQSLEMELTIQKINVDVAKGKLEDELTDAFINDFDWDRPTGIIQDHIGEFFGFSGARTKAEEAIKEYTSAIYNAADDKEVEKAGIEFRVALMSGEGDFANLSAEEKSAIDEKVQNFVSEQKKVIAKRKKDIAKDFQSLIELKGMSTDDAIKSLSEMYNISTDEVKKMLEQQKLSVAETEKQKETAEDLAGAWESATSENAKAIKTNVGALNELTKRLRDKNISKEDREELKKQNSELMKQTLQIVKQKKESDKIDEATQIRLGLKEREAKAVESEYENVKKIFELRKKEINNSQEEFEINSELARLHAGREKGLIDELALQERKAQSLQEEKKALLELFKVQQDEQGNVINVDVKLKKGEKKEEVIQEVNQMVKELNNQIARNEIQALEIQAKVNLNKKEIEEQLHNLELEQLKFDIEIGVRTKEDLVKFLEVDYEKIKSTIASKEQEILDFQDKLKATAGLTPIETQTLELEISERTKQLLELQSTELKARMEIAAKKKEIQEEVLNDTKESLEKEYAEVEKFANLNRSITDVSLKAVSEGMTSNLESEKDKRLKILEDQKTAEVITESMYNSQKLSIEEEFQGKVKALQDAARGAELEAERQQTLDILEEKKKQLEGKISELDPNDEKNKLALQELSEQLTALNDEIQDKGDILKAYSVELQSSMADIFGNLIGGNDEALKASAKKMFATVGGILRKAASATATKIILDQLALTPGGFLALLATPVISGVVNAAISKLIDPIISKLTSFSTGGRVDEPTLAVVGDASRSRRGSNTEWIFRDDQLALIIEMVIAKSLGELEKSISPLVSSLDWKSASKELSHLSIDELGNLVENSNMHLLGMYDKLNSINLTLSALPDNLKGTLTPSNIVNISNVYSDIDELNSQYDKGLMDRNKYVSEFNKNKLKIKSYAGGSGFIHSPEVALIGDAGSNNPEIVLNNPQLEAMIRRIGNNSSEALQSELASMRGLLQRLLEKDNDVYMDSSKVTDEVQRELNRRKYT